MTTLLCVQKGVRQGPIRRVKFTSPAPLRESYPVDGHLIAPGLCKGAVSRIYQSFQLKTDANEESLLQRKAVLWSLQ